MSVCACVCVIFCVHKNNAVFVKWGGCRELEGPGALCLAGVGSDYFSCEPGDCSFCLWTLKEMDEEKEGLK